MNPTDEAKGDDGMGETWDDATPAPDQTYPECPDNPHNHRYTISLDGRGPMIVVRGNTAREVEGAFEELERQGVTGTLAGIYSHMKAAMAAANGAAPAGPAQAPQGPPVPPPGPAEQAAQQYPTVPQPPAQQAPGQPYPGQPAWQQAGAAQPPAPPQQGQQWGGQQAGRLVQDRRPEYQQAGWYKVNFAYSPAKKAEFDGIVQQYQMKKGRPSEGGHFSFNKADKSWYVDPQYAGCFPQFSPVPA